MWRAALLAALLGLSTALGAAPLVVRVSDASGKPVRDAVVTFRPYGANARAPRGGRFVIAQKNLTFQPFLTIIPVGSDVSFPNYDPTKHHVYSFSPAKRFELKLFAKDQTRSVHFDKAGPVALGCNIHDSMSAFIMVTDSVWTQRTNAAGFARFADAPAVAGVVSVWHPYLRARGGLVDQAIGVNQRELQVAVKLRPPPPMLMKDY
jgi:plastocyanin